MTERFLRYDFVDKANFFGDDFVDDDTADGSLNQMAERLSGFVNVVDHDFHDGVNINTVLVVSDDSFFGAIEDEAFALGIGTQFGDVVETKHHVL